MVEVWFVLEKEEGEVIQSECSALAPGHYRRVDVYLSLPCQILIDRHYRFCMYPRSVLLHNRIVIGEIAEDYLMSVIAMF